MKKIAIVMAMEAEAQGIVKELELSRFVPRPFYENLPMQFFSGTYKNTFEIILCLPGLDSRHRVDQIGTEPSAVAAFATILEFHPDLLINAGTAGSFASKGASIGKVYLSKNMFYFHDHRIPIAGWDRFGLGEYPGLDVSSIAQRLNLDQANISSGNSLDFTQADLDRILESGAILKEMEAAGIAWAAFITQTPFFAIKSVTNLIDVNPDSSAEFSKNFAVAVAALNEKTLQVIKELKMVKMVPASFC